ncbi:hypothetical protein FKM82_014466 [Ascaphus truei]
MRCAQITVIGHAPGNQSRARTSLSSTQVRACAVTNCGQIRHGNGSCPKSVEMMTSTHASQGLKSFPPSDSHSRHNVTHTNAGTRMRRTKTEVCETWPALGVRQGEKMAMRISIKM